MNAPLAVIILGLGALLLSACGKPDPNERTLIEVVQPGPTANYGVYVWRQARSANPTIVYFGLAAFPNEDRNHADLVDDVEPFGVADFSASQVQYGWSDLKDFSVCAAKSKQLKTRESNVFSAVMDSTNFSSEATCNGDLFSSFPPSVGAKPQE